MVVLGGPLVPRYRHLLRRELAEPAPGTVEVTRTPYAQVFVPTLYLPSILFTVQRCKTAA